MSNGWNVFKTLVKIGVICGYIAIIVVLGLQALTPGSESADISNSVGDKINDVVTEIQKPEVTVVNVSAVEISSVTILGDKHKDDEITISLGATGKISTKVSPSDATNKAITFSSSDENIVYVSSDGRITAKAIGSAIISITSNDNDTLTDSVTFTVVEIPIEGIEIDNIPKEITVGEKHKLDINFAPDNTSFKNVVWASSDKDVLTVDKSGVITAKGEGVASISVTSKENPEINHTVEIQVLPKIETPVIPVESVKINGGNAVGHIGGETRLSAEIMPDGASGKVIWSSSDESVATISQSGTVKFLKAGEVTISAKCGDSATDSITIKVKEVLTKSIGLDFTDIKSSDSGYTIKQGQSGKVTAQLDDDATIFDIAYSSSDESIAKISPDGAIEAIKGGRVTITVSSSYDGETTSASFDLTVDPITLKDTMENFYYTIRKSIGHYGAFLVLGIFASFSYYIIFPKSFKGKLVGVIVCLAAGFAVAGITEILQLPYFTAGRCCSFDDVLLDFRGYCTSAIPLSAAILLIHPIAKLIKKQ